MAATFEIFTASGLQTDQQDSRNKIKTQFHPPSTAGHKQIGLEPKVRPVAEIRTVRNNLTGCRTTRNPSDTFAETTSKCEELTRQLHILILNLHQIAVRTQLRPVKVGHGNPKLRQSHKLILVDPDGVRKHTTPVDDSNRLV
jgi:hypothetical protein